jgi:hypothetical protein
MVSSLLTLSTYSLIFTSSAFLPVDNINQSYKISIRVFINLENFMKKKITLLLALLSLIESKSVYSAYAEAPPEIYHSMSEDGVLMIADTPYGESTRLLNATISPLGKKKSVKDLMETAHELGLAFCFLLCTTEENLPAVVLLDPNLHSFIELPPTLTARCKYKLYPGNKGTYLHPDFIMPLPQPSVVVQHMPYPVRVEVPVGIPTPYPVPGPVRYINKTIHHYVQPPLTTPSPLINATPPSSTTVVSPSATQREQEPTLSTPPHTENPINTGLNAILALLQAPRGANQPTSNTTTPLAPESPVSENMTSSPKSSITHVTRILQRTDENSAALIPLVSALTSSSDQTPAASPHLPQKNRSRKRRGQHTHITAPLAPVNEEEAELLEQSAATGLSTSPVSLETQREEEEKRVAEQIAHQQAEREALKALEEQQQKEAEERALIAAQEVRAHEQAKIRAEKAARRAAEETRLQKIKQEADQKEMQKKRDREAALLKKEQEKAALQEKEREAVEKKKADAAQKPKPAQGKQRSGAAAAAKSSKKDADDALLEKEIARTSALRAVLPHPQPGAAATGNSSKKRASLEFLPDLVANEDLSLYPLPDLSGALDGLDLFNPHEIAMEKITDCIDEELYGAAKQLLVNIPHGTLVHTNFLTDIYNNAKSLLTPAEIEEFMRNALKFAKDKKVDSWSRSSLYFSLALHASDPDKKEEYLDRCLEVDSRHQHLRAPVLKHILQLERHDAHQPTCKTKTGECIHKRMLDAVRELEAQGHYFYETTHLKISLLVKTLSGSCWQLTSLMESSGKNPQQELNDFYNFAVRQRWDHTKEELDRLHQLIPVESIPLDQRHQMEE